MTNSKRFFSEGVVSWFKLKEHEFLHFVARLVYWIFNTSHDLNNQILISWKNRF